MRPFRADFANFDSLFSRNCIDECLSTYFGVNIIDLHYFHQCDLITSQLDGDIATVGITAHAADALGDIVFVDLPSVGSEFEKGDSFGAVESVKAASDVYSPVSGEVVEINSALDDSPGVVNDSPIQEGWFMKIRLSDTGKTDFEGLMDESAYEAHAEAEG